VGGKRRAVRTRARPPARRARGSIGLADALTPVDRASRAAHLYLTGPLRR
jgi:hypothetical protein